MASAEVMMAMVTSIRCPPLFPANYFFEQITQQFLFFFKQTETSENYLTK
jgi:hypothetical protein